MGEGNARNKQCPCGSGKKYKYCCQNKIPRQYAIEIDFGEERRVDDIRSNGDGTFGLFCGEEELQPRSAKSLAFYKRTNGEKLLYQVPVDCSRLPEDLLTSFSQYDKLFAIDTNTRPSGSHEISVGALVSSRIAQISPVGEDQSNVSIESRIIGRTRFVDQKPTAEKLSLTDAIRTLMNHPEYNHKWRIGFVVDHDLGNLERFNRREIPVLDGFYLPDSVELIYASADKPTESIFNRMIAHAERLSDGFFRTGWSETEQRVGIFIVPDPFDFSIAEQSTG